MYIYIYVITYVSYLGTWTLRACNSESLQTRFKTAFRQLQKQGPILQIPPSLSAWPWSSPPFARQQDEGRSAGSPRPAKAAGHPTDKGSLCPSGALLSLTVLWEPSGRWVWFRPL